MKVFLSSTYNDLIEHRKAAHYALEQSGLQGTAQRTPAEIEKKIKEKENRD